MKDGEVYITKEEDKIGSSQICELWVAKKERT
jgi:hypothetical protein